MSDTKTRVMDVISKQLGVPKEKITMEASFINDLNSDSLDLVELLMQLEDEFNIQIPEEEKDKIQTVGDAVKYIEAKAKKS